MASTPPRTQAASFERKGFHTRYSVFSPAACGMKRMMMIGCTQCDPNWDTSELLMSTYSPPSLSHFQRITSAVTQLPLNQASLKHVERIISSKPNVDMGKLAKPFL